MPQCVVKVTVARSNDLVLWDILDPLIRQWSTQDVGFGFGKDPYTTVVTELAHRE